ncbi:MAG TPA: alpha-(1-_3)-arabinofuranosyltransferase family protein [Acidimicrobiales bacterium]|nr:alpha-(1->3)-arabinofuranosyltransferase family protein [Acidimicrobiales bacterium]
MRSRRSDLILAGVLAAVSYVPLFFSKSGMVAADTKQYLYLDPGRLTQGAASMWDPNTGLGTVTHQNIGYLFPMGPYYSAASWLGIPTWVAQRFWMGSLLFAAGLGVAYCARRLGLEGPGRWVATFAYTLSPYLIDYLGRTSAIVMPWAALGWMVGLTVMAARSGRWRYPALFAVAVALVGGVNATSILLVLVAPALWLVYGAVATREVTPRQAVAAGGRIALLSAGVSLWWAAGLWAEGSYGINILRVTETVPTVSRTSSASEVLRGLGYWYFYGWDKVQPWTLASVEYSQSLWLVAVSYLVPAAAVILGFFARWTYRAYAVALVLVGTVIAVGAYPYGHPSFFGGALKSASAGSTVALAMRSVDRIVPIVVLGLALMIGAGVSSLRLARPGVGLIAAGACVGLIAADIPPLWSGNLIASNLDRASQVPQYWKQAAAYMNSAGNDRVLGLPGEDFAAYSWGVAEDPIAPGLLDRPYVQRQVVPSGTAASSNLLQALDENLREGTIDTASIAPVARLMSAGQILLQSDLQYERYHLPLPQLLWLEMTSQRTALGIPTTFGAPNPAPAIRYPLNSELRLAIPTGTPQPPALAVFNVSDPRAMVRAEPASQPLIVAGDGSGLVEAAAAGLLSGSGDQPILYSASYAGDPAALKASAAGGAPLVLTDSNVLALARWGSLRDNIGQVDQPGVSPLSSNPSDYTLSVFPGAGVATNTVAEVQGVKDVRATSYGDPLSFTPEYRPINALDGDPTTAWSYGAHSPVAGGTIRIDLLHPVTAHQVTLLQAQLEQPNRRISRVTVTFDGKHPVSVKLTAASYSVPGQTVSFPSRTFQHVDITVDAATVDSATPVAAHHGKSYDGLSPVGFAEIGIPGLTQATETLRLPQDLLSKLGAASTSNPLYVLMDRARQVEVPRHDPEPQMSRSFTLPTSRAFSVTGTAEINTGDADDLVNRLIGLTPPRLNITSGAATVIAANSSTRLDGDRAATANSAVDGNPSTAWIAETGPQDGEWLGYKLSKPVTFDHLDLQVLNDGRHSLPSRLTISTENGSRTVDLNVPPVGNGRPQNSTTSVPLSFAPISGASVKVTIDSVREVRSFDYYSTFTGTTDILPVGIAELGLPDVVQPEPPAQIPPVCQAGLLSIDGEPVDVEVSGTTADAISGQPLQLRACGTSAKGITLGPGNHVVATSPRLPSGWSIDSLVLASSPGGAAAQALPAGNTRLTAAAPPARVTVEHQDRTSWDLTVKSSGQTFWLVLGQSFSKGWSATAGGRSLGAPRLVDGYATGWLVPPGAINGTVKVHIEWTPQRVVWAAIAASAVALLVSIGLAAWPRRRRARPGSRDHERRREHQQGRLATSSLRVVAAIPGSRPSAKTVIAASLGWGLAAAAASRPLIGAAALVATAAGCLLSRGRLAVRVLTVAALLAVPVYVVQQQAAHDYLPTIDWPAALSSANDIAWLGLALLGADAVAGAVLAAARRAARPNTLGGGGKQAIDDHP